MQTINQLTANLTTSTTSEQKQRLSTVEQIANQEQFQTSLDLIIDLFEQWAGLYGKKLQGRQNLSLQTAETWAVALKLMNVSKHEFDVAHAKSLCMEWPPTAAYDFLALARKSAPSIYPDARKAYEHAVDYSGRLFDDREDWRHVVIYETAYRIGFTKLATQSEKSTWYAWQQLYPQICSDHESGADFKLPLGKSRQLAHSHALVQVGSEADKAITAKLAELRRMTA